MVNLSSRLDNNRAFSSTAPFWGKVKRKLEPEPFQALVSNGSMIYDFHGAARLLLTVRATPEHHNFGTYVAVDAIDPDTSTQSQLDWVGCFHFSHLRDGEKHIAKADTIFDYLTANLTSDRSFLEALESNLGRRLEPSIKEKLKYGKEPPWQSGDCAFWVKPNYRAAKSRIFSGFSNLLMSTGARIARGLGADTLRLDDVGGYLFTGNTVSRDRLFTYYAEQYCARVTDEGGAEMEISI